MKTCQTLFDWITFVVLKATDPVEVIREVLGMNPALFEEGSGGIRGYYKSLVCGNIRVGYEGFGFATGVCVSMSGQGCRTYESHGGDFPSLLKYIHECPDINLTRLDIACDIRGEGFTMEDVVDAMRNRELRSHAQKRKIHSDFEGDETAGETAYIGSRKSDFFVRIYDKAKEVFDPQKEPDEYNSHWIRVELVLKKQYAANAAQELTNREDIGQFAAEVLNGHMAFINQDDSNISRCSVKDWWADFLQTLQSVKLWSKGEIVHTFEKSLDWAQAKIAPMMAMLYRGLGHTVFYEKIIMEGKERLRERHRSLIEEFRSGYVQPLPC